MTTATVYTGGASVVIIQNPTQPPPTPSGETIIVDGAQRFQSMRGWDATTSGWEVNKTLNAYDPTWATTAPLVMARLVNEMGCNRVHLGIRSGWRNVADYWTQFVAGQINYTVLGSHWYECRADGTPRVDEFDFRMQTMVVPMRDAMAARGEALYVALCLVDFGGPLPRTLFLANNPAEYAAFVKFYMDRARDVFGVTTHAVDITLEPESAGAASGWQSGANIGNAAAALRSLTAAEYPGLEIVAPSTANASNCVTRMSEMEAQSPDGFAAVDTVAYHRYDGPNATQVAAIKTWAYARGKRTAMSEWYPATIDTVIDDVLSGGVSHWQKWGMAGRLGGSVNNYYIVDPTASPPAFTFAPNAAHMSLVFPFVRFGAERIGATSSIGMKVMAFEHPNGKRIVHAKRTTGQPAANVTITGLVPGATYGVRRIAAASTTLVDDPDRTANANGWIVLSLAPGYTTVYQR